MIHLSAIDSALIILYFLIVIAVGIGVGKRSVGDSDEDFLLAGRRVTLPAFVATLVATWYGGILGVGEFSYLSGVSLWTLMGLPYYIFAIVFALFLAKPVRNAALFTIPDRFCQVYGKAPALFAAVLSFILVSPAPYVLMLGVLIQLVTGWSLTVCIIIGTLASTFYVATGGFRSDVRVNIAQFILMFTGFFIIVPMAVSHYGGMDFLQDNLPPSHLTLMGENSYQTVIVWFLIAAWTLVDPGFHQRVSAAKSAETARNGILLSVVCWAVFDFMTITSGLYARAALPELTDPKMSYPLLAEAVLPPVLKGIFYTGLLATIMSTVLSFTFLGGITIGNDIIGRLWGADNQDIKKATRYGLLLTGVVAVGLAIAIPSVVGLWYTIGSVCVPGLLVPLITSYFSQRILSRGLTLVTMASGTGISLIWMLVGYANKIEGYPTYPFGLEPMLPGLGVTILLWLAFSSSRGNRSHKV